MSLDNKHNKKDSLFEIESIELLKHDNTKTDSRLKKGLGRGLSSLLGDAKESIITNKVPIHDITRNTLQPRKYFSKESLEELSNSIKEQGVIQPIIVRPDKSLKNKYEIIAGERRWLASQSAGLNEVPVVVLEVDDTKSLEFAIIENVQRQDLNAVEEARGYKKLVDEHGYNHDKLAKFIGKSRSYIANLLRLLSLPEDIIVMIEAGDLSSGHARSLIGLNNSIAIARQIIKKKLSVRQAEVLARNNKDKKIHLAHKKDSNILDLQKTLEEKTGLSVAINNKKNNSGTISFEYKNLQQLDSIIKAIKSTY
jgi:ParB family chromosome partitioning protein|tara:strand:- start:180 stop:1109 length:930 start_codon:yes stop_codon:yes gene_type:complete